MDLILITFLNDVLEVMINFEVAIFYDFIVILYGLELKDLLIILLNDFIIFLCFNGFIVNSNFHLRFYEAIIFILVIFLD